MANGVLRPGAVFAGYRIERVLGVGGMGTVYLAAHPRLPRQIALKLLHQNLTGDNYVRSRFELEAEHAARLEHPNVVAVEDRGRDGGQLWIAMRYVAGIDAEKLLSDGPLDPARAVYIITETAEALDYAHEMGVLHRDVKPANILLERRGSNRRERVLLADFGIAKALEETTQLTSSGVMVASLPYAAPEAFDNLDPDPRMDVYALGCTLFRLLTGRQPYPGSTLPQLWYGHAQAPIPQPSVVRDGLPVGFDEVILRALAKKPGDRFRTCGELADAAVAALTPVSELVATPEPEPESPLAAEAPTTVEVKTRPVATPPPPSPKDRDARLGIASVTTRLSAVQTRAERLEPAYASLRSEFSAQCSADLVSNERISSAEIVEAETILASAVEALDRGDAERAVELTRAVRAHLSTAERNVDAVTGRLALLRAVRTNPKAKVAEVRFKVHDAQMLALNHGTADHWQSEFDAQLEHIDRVAAELSGPHPDYWAYITGLDDVKSHISALVQRMKRERRLR